MINFKKWTVYLFYITRKQLDPSVLNQAGASNKSSESIDTNLNRARSESPGGTRRRIVVRAVRSPSPALNYKPDNDTQVMYD